VLCEVLAKPEPSNRSLKPFCVPKNCRRSAEFGMKAVKGSATLNASGSER
jgi:hypothetical protein